MSAKIKYRNLLRDMIRISRYTQLHIRKRKARKKARHKRAVSRAMNRKIIWNK